MTAPISETRPYMLAQETPLLKGQPLCPFLSQMDEAESAVLTGEERSFTQEQDTFYTENRLARVLPAVALGSGAVGWGIAGVKFLCSQKAPSGKDFILLMSIYILTMGGGIGLKEYSDRRQALQEKVTFKITDERICRLQDKIRQIENKLRGHLEENEQGQLHRAKDYFRLKEVEMLSSKTNQIQIHMRHEHV